MATSSIGGNLKAPKLSVKEFANQNQPQPTLQDFVPNFDDAAPVANVPSNINTAAYAAALSPAGTQGQQMIDSYKDALSESNTTGQSVTATQLTTQARQSALQANVNPLLDILSNPNIDDATKRKAVETTYDANHYIYSPQNMLSTKALSQPLNGSPNHETDSIRYDMAGITSEINQNKDDIQKIYNSAASQSQPDLQQHIFDMGMNLLPFTKQYMMAKIRADSSGAPVQAFVKTFLGGVGTSTEALKEQIASLPVDQQAGAAQAMADIINKHSSIVVSTPDDEARRQNLQNILGGQGYSDKQEIADNVGSWMDLTMLGGPAMKGAKMIAGAARDVKGAVNAASTLNDSRAFFDQFEENYAKTKAANTPSDVSAPNIESGVVPTPPYTTTNKNSLGQFYRSRETQFYDSSNGIPYQKLPPQTVLSSAIRDSVRSQVQPVSIIQNLKDVNPDMARGAFESINLDASEEAAKALAGTDRSDAIVSTMMPEVAHTDGSVSAKVAQIDALSQTRDAVPPEVMDFLNKDGFTQYAQAEKAAGRAYKVNDFQSAIGLTPRGEMFQYIPDMSRVTDTPQGFQFAGVYGPMNSGFSDAQEALDTAKFALRNTDIDEGAMTLMRRDGDRYIPTNVDEVNKLKDSQGFLNDFLIGVNHDYRFAAQDVEAANGFQPLKVKLNFFDRKLMTSGRGGTLASSIFDRASQLDKLVVGPSVVGVDRAAGIEKAWLSHVGDMSKQWKSLEKGDQRTLLSEIQDANLNSRPYNYTSLTAKGIPQEGVDFLKNLQQTNDGLWFLKNQYFAKQLDKAGWSEFVHTGSNTNLPAKAIDLGRARKIAQVYNPATDTVDSIAKTDIDSLYNQNGHLSRLRQPIITPGGDVADHVIVENHANSTYMRKFTPNSQVLNYRPGYYGVQYKEPFHIVERVPDGSNKMVFEHSVATAKDSNAAKTLAARMNSSAPSATLADGNPRFYFRKAAEHDVDNMINAEYDVEQAQGMSSFKRRGQLLEDSTSNITTLDSAHVANPIEVLVNQVKSVSSKVVMQDTIDAQARRAIQQWGDFLPKDRFGQPVIPTDLREIKYRGGVNQDPSAVADARTSFGYINYLKHGYYNALDDGIKSLFHMSADLFGKIGLGKVEALTRGIAGKSLTNGLKSISYYAYMAFSPLHQIVLQGQQAALLSTINPRWLASIKAFSQPSYLSLRTLGMDASHDVAQSLAKTAWGSSVDAEKAYDQFVKTGLGAAVDHQNMVTGAVNDMAANMIANARNTVVSNALAVPRMLAGGARKIGFDAGEFYSSTMSWLAHRDLADKQGLNVLDDAVADTIHANSRNFTGNMNAAGALPQDKNAMAFLFQYTSNQQKMLLNMATNRSIGWQTKATLATVVTALYGAGQWHMFDSKLNSIQNPEIKDAMKFGLEGWALNKMLGFAFGGKSEIDWSSLSPINAYNFMDMLHQMITSPIGGMIANAPSTSMYFGNNPRIATAVQDALAFTHLRDDYGDNTSLLQVGHDFAMISSGYSAAMKAKYLLELKKKVSTSGKTTDEDLSKVNAIGTLLGFPTMRESELYQMQQNMMQNKKQVESDFNEFYRQANQHYADQNIQGSDLDHAQRMLTEFYRAYGSDNPTLNEMMDRKLKQDLKNGSNAIYSAILRNCQLYNKGDCMDLINQAPFQNEQDRQDLKDLVTFGNQFLPQPYDSKKDK